MGASRLSAVLISCCLAATVLLAGCGGGGGGGGTLPAVQAAVPPPAQPPAAGGGASAPAAVAFTIEIPTGAPSAKLRRPRYVSAGTKSATIGYGGSTQTVNCTTQCSALLQVSPGPATFVASLYDGPGGSGHVLGSGQTQTTIVPGQQNVVQITFDGVPATLGLALGAASLTPGAPATVPVLISAKDAAGYTIVGAAPYAAAIALADDDASGATALSTTSLAGPGLVALAYTGKAGPNAVRISASIPGTSIAPVAVTLAIGGQHTPPPSPSPSATPGPGPSGSPAPGPSTTPTAGPSGTPTPGPSGTPTPTPSATPSVKPSATPVPTPVPTPTQNPRTLVWSLGDTWGRPSYGDGQGGDNPVFAGSPASCSADGSGAAQCSGGTGAVSFHVQRSNTNTIPSPEYRNMMILQKWDPSKQYAFNYELVPNGAYDVRFQTVNHMRDDAQYVQSLIWQNHSGDGSVMTALGIDNPDGRGNQFYFNSGGHEGGIADPFTWHGTTYQGAVDSWEVQFRNAQDASGWIDLYRNGQRVVHYSGPVVRTTAYDLMSFGIYYYDWEISRSTVLAQDITFNYFELATIPGPVAPY